MSDRKDKMPQEHIIEKQEHSVIFKLREVTSELSRDPMTKTFKTMGGKDAVARSLMARNSIGIVDMSLPEGEAFPEHVHDSPIIEHLIIYTGRISVLCTADGKVVEKGPGEVCTITNEARHIVEAMEGHGNVRLIGITIPRDPVFPGELEE